MTSRFTHVGPDPAQFSVELLESLSDGLAALLVAEYRARRAAWLKPQRGLTIERQSIMETTRYKADSSVAGPTSTQADRGHVREKGLLEVG
jgi:hypothetical protein